MAILFIEWINAIKDKCTFTSKPLPLSTTTHATWRYYIRSGTTADRSTYFVWRTSFNRGTTVPRTKYSSQIGGVPSLKFISIIYIGINDWPRTAKRTNDSFCFKITRQVHCGIAVDCVNTATKHVLRGVHWISVFLPANSAVCICLANYWTASQFRAGF